MEIKSRQSRQYDTLETKKPTCPYCGAVNQFGRATRDKVFGAVFNHQSRCLDCGEECVIHIFCFGDTTFCTKTLDEEIYDTSLMAGGSVCRYCCDGIRESLEAEGGEFCLEDITSDIKYCPMCGRDISWERHANNKCGSRMTKENFTINS